MSTVAEQLHQAREARKLTIEQVAEITKIRTDHLRALEEGNFDVFSAPVYIRGFVRSLSTLLKLDVPKTMTLLEAELSQTRKFAEPPPLTGPPRGVLDFLMLQLSKVNWGRALVLLCVLAVLAGAGLGEFAWHNRHSRDPLRDLPPGRYRPAKGSAPTLPLPTPDPAQKR
jgi:cytoskeletal protein RodZ